MKQNTFQVVAAMAAVLLLSGCPAIPGTLSNNDSATTTTTSTTTTTLSSMEARTLSDADAVSGYGGKLAVVSGGRQYIIRNNVIDSSIAQTVEYSAENGDFTIKQHSGSSSTLPGSFPSIFIGNIDGHATTDAGLPKLNSALSGISVTWTWSDEGIAEPTDFLAECRLWFTSSAAGSISSPAKSVELWLFKPASHNPIGSAIGSAVIQDATWTIWSDGANIAYVAASTLTSINFDLNLFIKDAVTKGKIANTDYLHDVIAGFRIWSGGTGLSSSGFSVSVK